MNLIDAEVIKIISPIEEKFYLWGKCYVAKVEYIDDGGKDIKKLIFGRKEEADKLKVGYVFQH
jgi:hypothetical protein